MKIFKSKWRAWEDLDVIRVDYAWYLLQVSQHEDGRKRFRRTFIGNQSIITKETADKIMKP